MMQKDKNIYIAFVCTGNTCRSPMAEGIFNKIAEEKGILACAESFGTATADGMAVSENSVKVCREIGVDLTCKKSNDVNSTDLKKYDKLYCMSQSHADILKIYFGIEPERLCILGVCDPYGGDEEVYRICRNQIYNAVEEIITEYED